MQEGESPAVPENFLPRLPRVALEPNQKKFTGARFKGPNRRIPASLLKLS
jgi:hypothetical protein